MLYASIHFTDCCACRKTLSETTWLGLVWSKYFSCHSPLGFVRLSFQRADIASATTTLRSTACSFGREGHERPPMTSGRVRSIGIGSETEKSSDESEPSSRINWRLGSDSNWIRCRTAAGTLAPNGSFTAMVMTAVRPDRSTRLAGPAFPTNGMVSILIGSSRALRVFARRSANSPLAEMELGYCNKPRCRRRQLDVCW